MMVNTSKIKKDRGEGGDGKKGEKKEGHAKKFNISFTLT